MKVLILLLFVSSTLFCQVPKKDTLYFTYDDKYILFSDFNNNENFYNSYYPIKFSSEKLITKPLRDTVFIKYDEDILSREKNPNEKEFYYLIDRFAGKSSVTYFSEKKIQDL